MSYHVSVDVGGTFTDLFAVDAEAGSVIVQKTDTSEDAVGGVLAVLEQGGIPLERIEGFVVGTTLAINALVEGRTAGGRVSRNQGLHRQFGDPAGLARAPFRLALGTAKAARHTCSALRRRRANRLAGKRVRAACPRRR